MEEEFYGSDFAYIPAEKIPFDLSELESNDTIENNYGDVLLYYKKEKYFRLVTNDVTRVLNLKRILTTWKKQ